MSTSGLGSQKNVRIAEGPGSGVLPFRATVVLGKEGVQEKAWFVSPRPNLDLVEQR